MEVNYKVSEINGCLKLSIYTEFPIYHECEVTVTRMIRKEDFIKAGTLIDRAAMPFNLCYSLYQEFQERVSQELLRPNEYILDSDLRDKFLSYARAVCTGKFGLMKEEVFNRMVNEVMEYSEAL